MKSRIIHTFVLLLVCQLCLAQKHCFTLEETLQLARENNFSVQKSHLETVGSEETKKALFTQYFPHAALSATYFEMQNGLGISQMISSMIHQFAETGESGEIIFLKRGFLGGINVMQPVYTGGLIHTANKLADLNIKVNSGKERLKQTEVVQEAEKYFWNLVQCYESKAVLSTMDSLVERATHDADLALRAGLITKNDALEIGIYKSQLDGVRLLLDNGIDLCKAYLGHLTNQEHYDSIRWDNIFDVKTPVNLSVNHSSALELREESSLLDMQVEAYKLEKRMKLGMLLPKAFAGFNYSYHSFDIQNDGGIVKNLANGNNPSWMFVANVSVPLTAWWGGTHSLRNSNVKIRIAELDRSEKRSLMSLQMDLKWKELQRAYQQIDIARSQYEKAIENERQQSIAYRSGVVTMTNRLQAEALLEKAYTEYVSACVKYQIAVCEYKHVTGR